MRTVEAVIDPSGNVRLLADVRLPGSRRALVTPILYYSAQAETTVLLSEGALGDWNRPEEDAAWSHLQPGAIHTEIREPFAREH